MSIKQKQSVGIVVADINFFFSHRFGLVKKLSENYQILVISDLRNINQRVTNLYFKIMKINFYLKKCSEKQIDFLLLKVMV